MKDDDVWKCDCGENAFLLLRNGDIVCDACDKLTPAKVSFDKSNTS